MKKPVVCIFSFLLLLISFNVISKLDFNKTAIAEPLTEAEIFWTKLAQDCAHVKKLSLLSSQYATDRAFRDELRLIAAESDLVFMNIQSALAKPIPYGRSDEYLTFEKEIRRLAPDEQALYFFNRLQTLDEIMLANIQEAEPMTRQDQFSQQLFRLLEAELEAFMLQQQDYNITHFTRYY